MTHYALIMLLAGIGIPLLAALNSALGQHMGSPAAAALVLFCVAVGCADGGRAKASVRCGGVRGVLCAVGHLYRAAVWSRQCSVLCDSGAVDQHGDD